MAHQLNGGQLAALLQHWNHPVVRTLLGTAGVGIGSVVFYQNRDKIDMRRITYEVHRLTEPNQMLGPYVPKKDKESSDVDVSIAPASEELSVQYLTTSPAEGRSLPDLLCDTDITAQTDSSRLPGILDGLAKPSTTVDYTDLSHAITPAPIVPTYEPSTHTIAASPQPQEVSGVGVVPGLLGIAAIAGIASLMYKRTWSNQKQQDVDAQLIAWLQQTKSAVELQLVTANTALVESRSREVALLEQNEMHCKSEMCFKEEINKTRAERTDMAKKMNENIRRVKAEASAATKQHAKEKGDLQAQISSSQAVIEELARDKDRLGGQVTSYEATMKLLEEEKKRQATSYTARIEQLEGEKGRLESLHNLGETTTKDLEEQLRKTRNELSAVRIEKSNNERGLESRLQVIQKEKDEIEGQLQTSDTSLRKSEEQFKSAAAANNEALQQKRDELIATRKQNQELSGQLCTANSHIEEIKNQMQSSTEASDEALRKERDALAAAQNQSANLSTQLEEKDRVMESLRNSQNEATCTLNDKITDLENRIDSLSQQCEESRDQSERLSAQLEAKDRHIESFHAKYNDDIDMLNGDIKEYSDDLGTLEKERERTREQIAQLELDLEAALASKDDAIQILRAKYESAIEVLNVKLAQLLGQLGALAQDQKQMCNQNDQLSIEIKARDSRIVELTQEQDQATQHNEYLVRQLSTKGYQLSALRSEMVDQAANHANERKALRQSHETEMQDAEKRMQEECEQLSAERELAVQEATTSSEIRLKAQRDGLLSKKDAEKDQELKTLKNSFETALREKEKEVEKARDQEAQAIRQSEDLKAKLTKKIEEISRLALKRATALRNKGEETRLVRDEAAEAIQKVSGACEAELTKKIDEISLLKWEHDTALRNKSKEVEQVRDQAEGRETELIRKTDQISLPASERAIALRNKDEEMREARGGQAEATRRSEGLEIKLAEQVGEISRLTSECAAAASVNEQQISRIAELKEGLQNSQSAYRKLSEEKESLEVVSEEDTQKYAGEKADLEEKLRVAKDEISKAVEDYEAMKVELQGTQEKLSIAEEEVARLLNKGADGETAPSPPKNDDDDDDGGEDDRKNGGGTSGIEKDASNDSKDHDHADGSQEQDHSGAEYEQSPDDSKSASDTTPTEAIEQPTDTEQVADEDLRPGFTIPPENVQAVRDFGPISHKPRKKRTFLIQHLKQRNALSNPPEDDKIIPLELPCNDKYYRGLNIPKPLASAPEDPNQTINGMKVYEQCNDCHEWYTTPDRREHQTLCIEFFVYAAYCDGCGKTFVNNKAFREEHLPCNGTSMPKLPVCRHCEAQVMDITAHYKTCERKMLKEQNRICTQCKKGILDVTPSRRMNKICTDCRKRVAEEKAAANPDAPRGPRSWRPRRGKKYDAPKTSEYEGYSVSPSKELSATATPFVPGATPQKDQEAMAARSPGP